MKYCVLSVQEIVGREMGYVQNGTYLTNYVCIYTTVNFTKLKHPPFKKKPLPTEIKHA
jgi:hypothetical protein